MGAGKPSRLRLLYSFRRRKKKPNDQDKAEDEDRKSDQNKNTDEDVYEDQDKDQVIEDEVQKASSSSPLLDLPYEIRSQIFMLLYTSVHIHAYHDRYRSWKIRFAVFPFHHLPPDILQRSKDVHFIRGVLQAKDIFYDPANGQPIDHCAYCFPRGYDSPLNDSYSVKAKIMANTPCYLEEACNIYHITHPQSHRIRPSWTACKQLYSEFGDLPFRCTTIIWSFADPMCLIDRKIPRLAMTNGITQIYQKYRPYMLLSVDQDKIYLRNLRTIRLMDGAFSQKPDRSARREGLRASKAERQVRIASIGYDERNDDIRRHESAEFTLEELLWIWLGTSTDAYRITDVFGYLSRRQKNYGLRILDEEE